MVARAVIFDLDGVLVSTDQYHFQAWLQLAQEEGLYFDEKINERLRGVSRMESLDIILERAEQEYSCADKLEFAARKNGYYQNLLQGLCPTAILPGALEVLDNLEQVGVKTAIGSSSKNAPIILEKLGLRERFAVVADGNQISKSKPDPEVFLLAAQRLKVKPSNCVVIEDAEAGIDAALAAQMIAVGVGSAANYSKCHYAIPDLRAFRWEEVVQLFS